jgi:transposase
MEVVVERGCGLDVHADTVVGCVHAGAGAGAKQTRTFGTTTEELPKLSDWLSSMKVTHVAMESTGVYWKPVYNLLEGHFELLVVNAQHIKGLRGRKTDVGDSEWLSDLMSHFEDADHLASWAGMCPGNNQSGGKRLSGKTRKGSRWLRATLTEAAHGAARTKNCYLSALYHRIASRRGKKRALVAVGHAILGIVYALLSNKSVYHDLGANYFDQRDQSAVQRRLIKRLERLGLQVTVTPATVAT